MVDRLYLTDSYVAQTESVVIQAENNLVQLDKTCFYPEGGGQPSDKGEVVLGDRVFSVIEVYKDDRENVYHRVTGGLPALGEKVVARINWPLRYAHMRHHTALHIVSGSAFVLYGAKITGSRIYADRARMDLSIEDFSKEKLERIFELSNTVVNEKRRVLVKFVERQEVQSNPGLLRVDPSLYPSSEKMRIIEIEGFDAQFDGGTHVSNTEEVGSILLSKFENKGKTNKRIELVLGSDGVVRGPK
jgi:misacylated tRNA(Ala) deacylase